MGVEVSGDALCILHDFLIYSELYPEMMADVMHYDIDRFKRRVDQLAQALNTWR